VLRQVRLKRWIICGVPIWIQLKKIVFEQYFNDSEGQAPASPGDLQMPVNPLWRELAHSDLKSDLSSTCGCSDHEHHFS
jgi:hypothetical protein